MGSPNHWGHTHTLCQVLELLPCPEEVRVWLLLPQFYPVAVTVEILVQQKKGNKTLVCSHSLQP